MQEAMQEASSARDVARLRGKIQGLKVARGVVEGDPDIGAAAIDITHDLDQRVEALREILKKRYGVTR